MGRDLFFARVEDGAIGGVEEVSRGRFRKNGGEQIVPPGDSLLWGQNMDRTKLMKAGAILLNEHGLHSWEVELRTKTGGRLGGCHYKYRVIELNDFFVDNNSDETVVEILRHEVAHALTPGHNHDSVWRAMAIQLGCTLDRNCRVMAPPGKYKAVCPGCSTVFYKYRKPKYVQGYYCPRCGKEHGKLVFHTGEKWAHPVV